MADKKKKNMEEAADGKKLAALEARIEGLNEQLELRDLLLLREALATYCPH